MTGPDQKRWWSPSPAELGVVLGITAFLLALLIPAVYVAPFASKHTTNRRAALTPEEAAFLQYVERNWTEEAGLAKAFGFGLSAGIVGATSGFVVRSLKRREADRRV
jgi:type II secretory pathway component PulM